MAKIRTFRSLAFSLALLVGLAFAGALSAGPPSFYQVTSLVSNDPTAVPALHTDANLVNGWGIARSGTSPIWVADNGTGVATVYNGDGVAFSLVVTIPPGAGGGTQGVPTGNVFNPVATDFLLTPGPPPSNPARFIFATEDGTISGWNPTADATNAIIKVDKSTDASPPIYKGLALAAHHLYAADFHNAKVDVFDNSFAPATLAGNFSDPRLPAGYAPFGIQEINGHIFVAYAKQDEEAEDEIAGQGKGIVDEFGADGTFIRRIATHGLLNAPWGMALAPANFGPFSNALLVGNFGDGRITAIDISTSEPEVLGQLHGSDGKRIVIDGLWGIVFGNGSVALDQPANTLFFAAGPNDEEDGQYGRIDFISSP